MAWVGVSGRAPVGEVGTRATGRHDAEALDADVAPRWLAWIHDRADGAVGCDVPFSVFTPGMAARALTRPSGVTVRIRLRPVGSIA